MGDIRKRLERLTAPDREVDALILIEMDDRPKWTVGYGPLWVDRRHDIIIRINNIHPRRRSPSNPSINDADIPRYTASLDAAVALVERVDKGFIWRVDKHGARHPSMGEYWATCGAPGEQEQEQAWGPTAPITLLCALFTYLALHRPPATPEKMP